MPDLTEWSYAELEAELRAWAKDGDGARLEAEHAHTVIWEMKRRKEASRASSSPSRHSHHEARA